MTSSWTGINYVLFGMSAGFFSLYWTNLHSIMVTIVTFLWVRLHPGMRRGASYINDEATLGQEISCLASASYYLTQVHGVMWCHWHYTPQWVKHFNSRYQAVTLSHVDQVHGSIYLTSLLKRKKELCPLQFTMCLHGCSDFLMNQHKIGLFR